MHEEILRLWPHLADVVALHLSDDDGAPMHAEADALYWLAGATASGLGEEYTGATGYPKRTPEQCLEIAASHLRIPLEEARAIAATLEREGKGALHAIVEAMRPRWKQEAEQAIRKYGLRAQPAEVQP